jgi:hypothetical protein
MMKKMSVAMKAVINKDIGTNVFQMKSWRAEIKSGLDFSGRSRISVGSIKHE